MGAYRKLLAAFVTILLTRWALQALGLDVNAMGLSDDLREAVSLAIDAVAAAVPSFFVWLIPNVDREYEALKAKYQALAATIGGMKL